jgi:predicted alpha/beta-hydrolase family hydrolase
MLPSAVVDDAFHGGFMAENSDPNRATSAGERAEPIAITVDDALRVSGLLQRPPNARACFVLAHGAGAGMHHAFLAAMGNELGALGVATLRYQFPYMERRSRRPDPPELCHAAVRAAVAEASRVAPEVPLFAGGKSFGGRMTSQAQALQPLPGVRGIAFLGFPLHPPGRPSDERGRHLFDVQVPMLFLQGTRDEFAELALIEPLVSRLGKRATLKLFQDADHSYHVPARSGRKDPEIRNELARTLVRWIESEVGRAAPQ